MVIIYSKGNIRCAVFFCSGYCPGKPGNLIKLIPAFWTGFCDLIITPVKILEYCRKFKVFFICAFFSLLYLRIFISAILVYLIAHIHLCYFFTLIRVLLYHWYKCTFISLLYLFFLIIITLFYYLIINFHPQQQPSSTELKIIYLFLHPFSPFRYCFPHVSK